MTKKALWRLVGLGERSDHGSGIGHKDLRPVDRVDVFETSVFAVAKWAYCPWYARTVARFSPGTV